MQKDDFVPKEVPQSLPESILEDLASLTLDDDYILKHLTVKIDDISMAMESRMRRKRERAIKKRSLRAGIKLLKKSKRVEGDVILEKLRNILSKRSINKHQQIILEILIPGNFDNIYGDAFENNRLRIMRENSVSKIKPYALVGVPRRWGKSYILAWFIAVVLVVFKGVKIAIFAPALRQCEYFIEMVSKGLSYIHNILKIPVVRSVDNKLTIEVESQIYPGVFNRVESLSCNADTTRGVGANIIIADELSYIMEAYILSVILPLLTVAKTSFAGISTVNGEENHFFKFLSMHDPDDDNSAIEVYQFYAACFKCRHSGKASVCKHMVDQQPIWITQDRKQDVNQMYAALGNEKMAEQELSGVVRQMHSNAFKEEYVNRMFALTNIVNKKWFENFPGIGGKPPLLFSFIDPTHGGASHLAVVTAAYVSGILVIVGLESFPASQPSDLEPIVTHYETIRKDPFLGNIPIGIWVEGNLLWQYGEIVRLLRARLRNIFIYDKTYADSANTLVGNSQHQGGHHVGGQITNHLIKQSAWLITRDHLTFNKIMFYEGLVTVKEPPFTKAGISMRAACRALLFNQLLNFFVVVQPAQNPAFQRPKVTFTGKTSKTGGIDDLAISMQLLIDAIIRIITSGNLPTQFSA